MEQRFAGHLRCEQDHFIFRYQESAAPADFVSLTMPVRLRDYTHNKLHPIFEMHLPEGYLLSVVQRHFAKVLGSDELSLLTLLAPGVQGRIQYRKTAPVLEPLSLDALLHPEQGLFDELVQRFALFSPVSGVQPKVLAKVLDKAALRLRDYIVKAWGSEYPQLALNEYWCMRVHQLANIPTPEFHLSDDGALFITRRFDILENGEYLGFEDLCVLQAKSRGDKYEGSYEQLAKTLHRFVSPPHKVDSLQQFFKMIVLCQRLQNGDAHLKNFGVLYHNANHVWLAPAYDIVSTTAYIKNDVSALTLMGSRKWWGKKPLLDFGVQHCALTPKQAEALYLECEQAMRATAKEVQQQIEQETTHEGLESEKLRVLGHLLALLSG
ncbi:Conserved hypothetical protein [gamma proteobacterium HdN1]|nr:Conserved hypothetical protein [gamma proteobacterium HdN1]